MSVSLTVYSQTTNATLSGVVEDPAGKVVAGVKITITNPATGLERTVISDDSGAYLIPLLPPATYNLLAEATGFKRVQFPDIVLNVNDQRSLRIYLEIGDVTGVVEVRPDDGITVRTDPSVSTVIPGEIARNMPLNGRSFSSLVLLTPGVTVANASTTVGLGQFSVNGQRTNANYLTVDGVSANVGVGSLTGVGGDLAGAYPGQSAFGGTNNLVSIDALQEFKLQTSTYTAESGRQPGGQIQVITRTGKNEYSGSVFDYVRNEVFDARDFFNVKPQPQPELRQNHFGGIFSGPLPFLKFGETDSWYSSGKDRTFFFFSYEGQRLRLPASGRLVVPSVRLRNAAPGSVQTLLAAYPIPTEPEVLTNTACPVPPQPPNPACDTASNRLWSGIAFYNYALSNPRSLDATSIRIDHNLSNKHLIFGRFSESPSESTSGVFNKAVTFGLTRALTLGLTSTIGASLINDLRFNFTKSRSGRENFLTSVGGGVAFDRNLIVLSGDGRGTVNFSQIGAPGSTLAGITVGVFASQPVEQFNVVNNVTVTKGDHQIKFGFDFRRLNSVYGARDQNTLTFSGQAGVLSGALFSGNLAALQEARPTFDNFSAYVQDTWRLSKSLTFDLGLRWEFNPPPTEANGQVPRVALGIVGTDVTNATLAPEGTPFFKTFYRAFAPRIGAAYQIFETSGWETVLRGGVGLYYDLGSTTAVGGWPRSVSRTLTGACLAFPVSATCSQRPEITSATSTAFSLAEDLTLPYTLQWSLGLDQSLERGQTISMAYVGSAGRDLLATLALNGQRLNAATGGLTPRPNPNFGQLFYSFNRPTADYHALQVQHTLRLSNKLQSLINYTWAHAIDEVSVDLGVGANSFERGNSSFDIRHNLSAAVHFEFPNITERSFFGQIFRDWSLDGLIHAQTGAPINLASVPFTFDDVTVLVRPDLVLGQPLYIHDSSVAGGRRFNPAAFEAAPRTATNIPLRQGTLGRNVLRELPLIQFDIGLAKKVQITEKISLLFKGEAFNVFNRPMFGNYGTSLSTPTTFGVPQTTMNQNLGGMDSLYQLGGPRSIQLSARLSF